MFAMQLELLAKQAGLSTAQPEMERGTHVMGVLPGWDLVSWLMRSGRQTCYTVGASVAFTNDSSPTSGQIHAWVKLRLNNKESS